MRGTTSGARPTSHGYTWPPGSVSTRTTVNIEVSITEKRGLRLQLPQLDNEVSTTRCVTKVAKWLQIVGLVALLAGVSGLALSLLPAQQTDSSNSFRLGANLAGVIFLSDIDVPERFQDALASTTFNDALGVGLEAGKRFSERWEVEAHLLTAFNSELEVTTLGGRAVAVDKSIASSGLSGVYYLLPRTPIQPFVKAGGGVRTTDLATLTGGNLNWDPTVNVGAGIAAPVTERFSIRFAARNLISWYDEISEYGTVVQNDLYLTAGGHVHF